jgi:hypothetical protein
MLRLGAALLATAALGGCGGGDQKDTTTAAAPAPAPATTTETTAAVATTETTPAETSGSGNLTPIGSTLKMGETATIAYKDSSKGKRSTVEITPESIEKGSLSEDFKNIDLDADQKTATPFYVKVKAKNVGTGNLDGTDPAGFIDGIDDRGQEQGDVIFFGDFARCPDAGSQKKLRHGDSYETCLTYLIPKGGSLVGMRWIVFDEKTGKSNIDWK